MFSKSSPITAKHILLTVLCICLISIIILFLKTSTTSPKAADVLAALDKTSTQNPTTQNSTPSPSANTEQPDKSLPIPAHQLKKMIANSDQLDDAQLQAKIDAANQSIAQIDNTLKALPNQPKPEITSTAQASNTSSDNQDIQQRLQNIRDHLNKQQ